MTVKLWRVHEIIAGFCRNPQDGSSARAVSFRPSRWSSELARSTVRRSPVSWCHLRQMAAPRGIRMKTSSPSSAPSGGGFCWYFPPGKHIALRCVVSNMNISKNFWRFRPPLWGERKSSFIWRLNPLIKFRRNLQLWRALCNYSSLWRPFFG